MATKAAAAWLRRRSSRKVRAASLLELAAAELGDPLQVRKLENLVDTIGLQVAEHLNGMLTDRLASLPENEIQAALAAATDALAAADLSDDILFATDASPDQLSKYVRDRSPHEPRSAGLSEAAASIYRAVLDQACRHLVQVVRHLPAFPPRALAETLARLSTQSAQLDELLARLPRTSLHAPNGTDHDDEFTAAYLHHLSVSLDRMEMLGQSAKDQPRLALSTAYLSMSVSENRPRKPRSPREHPERNWFGQPDEHGGSMRAEAAICTSGRTLVRGEAGSGKTTLLDWLAVSAARSGFTAQLEPWNGCVPFPIRLRSYAGGELPPPEQFVAHSWPMRAAEMPDGWAHRRLLDGTGLILVDGVDEVPAGQRHKIHAWLHDLVVTFPDARVVVTARPAAVDEKWLADVDFSTVTLEQMDQDDQREFVGRWHRAASHARSLPCEPSELVDAEQRLLSQFECVPHLRTLGANPMLCAMLCALNLDHGAQLPRDRMDLYARALTMLLEIRDTRRGIDSPLDAGRKRVLLRDIAWRLTLANRIELVEDKALDHVERKLPGMPDVTRSAREILDHLIERSGVLRQPAPGRVDFVHRAFQDYLAASEATEQGHIDTLVGHAHVDAWWDAIVMACGHAKKKQADELLTEIVDRADREPAHARHLWLLAAACLETVIDIDPVVHKRIDSLIRQHLVPPRGVKETVSLAAIGHRVLRYLPSTLDELSETSAAATVRTAALTANTEALSRLAGYASDRRTKVQLELINGWDYFDPQRYAEEVLADAPLGGGWLIASATRFLPHVKALRHLTDLWISIDQAVPDLDILVDLPALTTVFLQLEPRTVDLAPLAQHGGLAHVSLNSASDYTGLGSLAGLPNLETLRIFQQASFTDIDFVRDLPGVEILGLGRVDDVVDYAPLDALPKLANLWLWNSASLSTSTGEPWPMVTSLRLIGNRRLDARRVAELFPNLHDLWLYGSPVGTVQPFSALPLDLLGIYDNGVPVDVASLADATLTLSLSRDDEHLGVDSVGPRVRIKYAE
nr:NACHT domain-containing protein [Kibdelosporangium sp. MJ126-NF4]CEL20792.1 putative large ATP-binding protein [Kibdelosporangium sp. MJ126-NF4]CTQ98403.1 putative large ATP-binding protein [Kibdelosporangium sp. MJ126-NF4]